MPFGVTKRDVLPEARLVPLNALDGQNTHVDMSRARAAVVEFALLVEAGPLEAQSLLLVESLRRFGGRHASAPVTVVSPRPTRRPSPATAAALRRLGADYLELDVEGACPVYPTSWRVHALAILERRAGPEVLVQLDTDTLFLGDIGPLCASEAATARPVDVKGMGSTGPGDDYEAYWAELCQLAGIDVERLPFVCTAVGGPAVRATHNGGFVAARRDSALFARAEALFRHSVEADLRPHAGRGYDVVAGAGRVGVAGSEWWGSAQAVISVAAASLGFEIGPLDERVNVPVHLWHRLDPKPDHVIHAHYHGLLGNGWGRPNALLDGSMPIDRETESWLRSRVPLAL